MDLIVKRFEELSAPYARQFYENFGFVQVSEEFLEDGIPHIEMLWKENFKNGLEREF